MTWVIILYVLGLVPAVISLRDQTSPLIIWIGTIFWPILSVLTIIAMLWLRVKWLVSTYLTFTWR